MCLEEKTVQTYAIYQEKNKKIPSQRNMKNLVISGLFKQHILSSFSTSCFVQN